MNTPSPLIPQGTFLDKPGRAHIRIAVFTILAIHVVLLGALLLQGCKRTSEPTTASAGSTNIYSSWQGQDTPPPPMNLLSNMTGGLTPPPPPMPSAVPGIDPSSTKLTTLENTEFSSPPSPGPLARNSEVIPPPPPPPARDEIPSMLAPSTTGTEYVILKGDTFSLVAKRFGVKPQEIANANPTVDPRRLQIGQKIFVPAPSPAAASVERSTSDGAQSGKEYVVKSGDTLIGIAGKYKTTVSKIRSANGLRTDRIVVGQKLKIPE